MMMKSCPRVISFVLLIMLLASMFSVPILAQESNVWQRTEVDSSRNVGDFNSIAVDSNGSIHISYYDATEQALKYATNAGGSWKTYIVDPGNQENATGQHTSIAVDSSGVVHIAYTSEINGSACLKYATNSGDNWTTSFVDFVKLNGTWKPRALNPDATTSIALNSHGDAYISCQGESGRMRLVTNAGGDWSNLTMLGENDSARGGDFNSIAIDANDHIYIAYHATVSLDNESVSNLSYITNAPGKWTNYTVDDSGDVGTHNSIKVASGIHIAYRSESSGALMYANSSGNAWNITTIASGDTGYFASLGVDGGAQIICENKSDLSLDYFSSADNWTMERVWNHGNSLGRCSLALNSSGAPQIAIQNPEGKNLVYVQREGPTPTPGEMPSAPQNLKAEVNKTVLLTWNETSSNGSSAIISYHVYRNGALLAKVTNTSYNDTNVTVGSYEYGVSALNKAGEGPNSTISVNISKKASLPSAPRDLKAQAGKEEINLTWSPPANDGGSSIIDYRVYRNGSAIATINDTKYTDNEVQSGVEYNYSVSAIYKAGEGAKSDSVTAIIEISKAAPGEVQDLSAKVGNGYVLLSWKAPDSDGGSPITDYKIYRNGDNINHTGSGSILAFNDTGLSNGKSITYGVSAVNSVREGKMQTMKVTPMTVPGPVENLKGTAGDRSVNLTWQSPESDGGSKIISYHVYRDADLVSNTTATNYSDTGLKNGQLYNFSVSVVNQVGEGPKTSIALTPAPTKAAPSPPQNLTAKGGNENVTLTWSAPDKDGSSSIIDYRIYRDGEFIDHVGNASTTRYVDKGLVNGQEYAYGVTAVNDVGESENATATATPSTIPSEPTSVNATPGNRLINLTWSPPDDNGGSAITGYKVFWRTSPGGEENFVSVGNVLNFSHSGLSPGTAYYYQIAATNSNGDGNRSAQVSATTWNVPDAPNLMANWSGGGIQLQWTAPPSNGAAIDYYALYRNGNDLSHPTTLTFSDFEVVAGQQYAYTVRAHNAVGLGPASNSQILTSPDLPTAPQLKATEGSSHVLLDWTAPESGGSAIINYTIYRGTESGKESLLASVGSILSYNDTAVTNGVTYYYFIAAANRVGQGPNSSEVNVTPFSPVPPECRIVTNITSGDVGTEFNFTCVTNASEPQVRWDYENDGIWDTNFSSDLSVNHSYNKTGEHTVKVEVNDQHNLTSNATTSVSVQAPGSGSNTAIIMFGIIAVLAMVGVIGLYIMRKRGI